MSSLQSQALTKRSTDSTLMPPPPAPKRIKRPTKILDEEIYTDALSHIIARDFFPGLVETEAQQEYLNSLDSQDAEWIAAAGRNLTEVMTPGPDGRRMRGKRGTSMTPLMTQGGETPTGFVGDTPGSVISTASSAAQKPEVDTNMSLSAFQTKYTSEDNESFYKLLDKQNQKKVDKYAWLWSDNKIPAARQIAYRKQQFRIEAEKNARELEDGADTTALIVQDLGSRKAMPDTWKSRPDNNLYFEPQSIEDSLETVQQKAEEASKAAPKAVNYDNTRFQQPTKPSLGPSIPASPSLSAVKDAVAGRPRLSDSEYGSYTGNETPRVNGYAFVDSEPSPEPEKPQQDWSRISFGPVDATPNPFNIKEKSSRESLHHRIVDKVAKGKRIEKMTAQTKTPVPKFASSPRVARDGMTPAAQRLLGKVGGRTPKGGLWEGQASTSSRSGLNVSWTPKVKTPRLEK